LAKIEYETNFSQLKNEVCLKRELSRYKLAFIIIEQKIFGMIQIDINGNSNMRINLI
jgi:hypothetical protein